MQHVQGTNTLEWQLQTDSQRINQPTSCMYAIALQDFGAFSGTPLTRAMLIGMWVAS